MGRRERVSRGEGRVRLGSGADDMEVLAVRIGIDMLAVQSPHHGARGIGRYSGNLVSTLLERDDNHEYVLYIHEGLPLDRVPTGTRAEIRVVTPRWALGETMAPCMDRLARTNPDGLDALVILSPFEKWASYAPPSRPDNGLRMIAIVYDLIPFLFQNEMALDKDLMRHYHVLETITQYDGLLAISEATRADCLSVLRLAPDRIVNISAASDSRFFVPDRSPESAKVGNALAGLGIMKPFLLNVGGLDARKNTWKLIEAFASLPARLRETHQLVLTFMSNAWAVTYMEEHIKECGVEGSVVLTGEVSDSILRMLYQRCELFTLPSLYEGFGLPLLEAMHCGAAVVGGNNSSQIEVVGEAGLLAEACDANDIAAKLAMVLDDQALKQRLRRLAPERAKAFHWGRTAGLALEVIGGEGSRGGPKGRVRFDRGHLRKPTIAFFSPLPPRKSGVADYSAFLLEELRKEYRIDIFHDAGYVPEPALARDEYMSCDSRLFDRVAAAKDYHAIVYQMGNSRYHSYMYPIMLRHKGLITLHDFCLAGFYQHYGHSRGLGRGLIADELREWHPEDREAIDEALRGWSQNGDEIARDCARNGWFLNRRLLDAAQLMVVHSPWCEEQVKRGSPAFTEKVAVIPQGVQPRRTTAAERLAIRERYSLAKDALVVASFGFVHPDKMSPQALDAFAEIVRKNSSAVFVFVGEEADGGEVRRHASALGLNQNVRFLGRQPAEGFAAMMAVTDVGVNLRLPPTNGETSAALLNLLAAGIPTVVTDVATFSDYPDAVVQKVRWETEGQEGLLRAMRGLAEDAGARESLGKAAWAYVDALHEWSRVGKVYVEAIERCREEIASTGPTISRKYKDMLIRSSSTERRARSASGH